MQYLLLFVAVVVLAIGSVVLWRPSKRTSTVNASAPILGLAEPDPVLGPVLLPLRPAGEDIDALRLATGLRGYRCDQVDGVLDTLSAEVDRLREAVVRLEEEAGVSPELSALAAPVDAAEEPVKDAGETNQEAARESVEDASRNETPGAAAEGERAPHVSSEDAGSAATEFAQGEAEPAQEPENGKPGQEQDETNPDPRAS